MSFETKFKRLFEEAKIESAYIFYIPEKGDDVYQFDRGLCGHQLIALGEAMIEEGEERLKTEEEHE